MEIETPGAPNPDALKFGFPGLLCFGGRGNKYKIIDNNFRRIAH